MSWVAVAVGGGTFLAGVSGNIGSKKRAKRDQKGMQRLAEMNLNSFSDATSGETAAINNTLGEYKDLYDLFGSQASKSYLDTTEGKAFSSMIDDRSTKSKDKLRSDMNLMGGTTEAYLAGLGQISEAEGSSVRDLVAGSDQRRSNLQRNQMTSLSQILGTQQNLLANKTGQVNNAWNIGSNAYGRSQQRNDAQNQNNAQSFQNALSLLMMSQGVPPV